MPVAELAASPAVALFVDRARAVRPGFALTEGNAAAVAEICRRLEGLPLAIELAAARTRLLDPGALLGRLARSLDALGTGAVDLPERQRTLRATVEWSVGLLEDAERSLLEIVAVFVDGWTVEAAAQVAGLDEDRALDLTEALARHSLIYLDPAGDGPRPRMLETIRAFVAERLAARPDAAEIERRHADYYRALAEQADRPLRGAGQREWCERLEAEEGNLAAAVRWYLATTPGRCRTCSGSCGSSGSCGTIWARPAPGSASCCPPPAPSTSRPRSNWCGRRRRPASRSATTKRRWRPASAWRRCSTGSGTPTSVPCPSWSWRGPRGSSATSTARCGRRRSPWSSSAARTSRSGQRWPPTPPASLEMTIGRYDDALRHLTEMRDLAERLDNPWLAAVSRVYLGTLAVAQGRPEEARALMDEGLELSLAAHSTRSVTLCLAAFARLAFVEGDPERAALLAGAADGLRRRVGLRAWPLLRRERSRAGRPGPPGAGRGPVRPGVRRWLPAQPAGGGGRRPRPARRRHRSA